MPRFTYISRDVQGQRVTAVAEAETRQSLLNQLKERGLTVVQISEVNGQATAVKLIQKKFSISRWSLRGASSGDLALFWREFATMIAAGLPIVEALDSIASEMEKGKFKKILEDIVSHMWEGFNLSESLASHPQVFSRMVVALIGAAEESGSLPEVSNQLATFLENRDRLFRKVRAALTYPVFLAGFFLVVIAVATFWIIPMFKGIYEGFRAELPQITQIVFKVNSFVLAYFPWIAAGLVLSIVALIYWVRDPKGRAVIDRVSLKLPIFGKLLQRAAIARFSRSLAILLSGGIPINRALEMAQETAGNSVVAKAIQEAREEILKGGKIAASLKKHPIFPRMAVRMVAVGEETGSLSGLLEKTADFYESRVDASLTTINTLIEPIMIIMIGIFVLIFVLALYMPIFKLAMTIKG